jgi:hypothetical protein
MLVFAHVCIGAIAGLYFARWTGERYMLLVGILGSLLPDLVDKPLEVFGLGDLLGYEVLVLHTLLALVILCLAGLIAYRFFSPPVPAIMALLIITVGLHQVMDIVWANHVKWLSPFLGPIPRSGSYPSLPHAIEAGRPAMWVIAGLGVRVLFEELRSASEWIFALVTTLILLVPWLGGRAVRWGAALLGVISLWTLASFGTLAGLPVPVIDAGRSHEELLLLVSAAGAVALWYYDRGERKKRDAGEAAPGTPQ